MKYLLLAILAVAASCSDPTPVDTTGKIDQVWKHTGGRSTASGSLGGQGGAPVTSISGVIDPTNAAFAGGLVPCNASCSTGLMEQNRAALQSAIDAAVAQKRNLYIPPGSYPIGRKASAAFSIDFGAAPQIFIDGLGVTLRMSGDATSTDFAMFFIHNTSQVRLRGLTFSHRDVTNSTTKTTAVLIGDAGATTADTVNIEDCSFIEGLGGDFIRMDGGSSVETITKVMITRSRFENSARAAIDVRPGVRQVIISYNFFKNNANRDIYFEPLVNNTTGRFEIVTNTMERATSATAASVTLSGFSSTQSAEQSHFRYNRISGGTIEGINLGSTFIEANYLEYARPLGSGAMIDLSGHVSDVWVLDNYMNRMTGANDGPLVKVNSAGSDIPLNVTVRGNRMYQFTGSSPAIDMSGSSRFSVLENKITYHSAVADSGSTGFAGIYCAGTSTGPCSGQIARNSVVQDAQDIHATLNIASVTTNDNTVVQSRQIGAFGNSITLSFVGDAVTPAGTLHETGTASVVHYQAGFTTVANVQTLITTFSSLLQVKTVGTSATVLQATVDAFGATPLAGGLEAGRMLAGIEVVVGSGSTIGRMSVRDNSVDGAATAYYIDGNGSAAYPEGYPLLSGTFRSATTGELAGGATTYRSETTADAETIASGALSVSRHVAFITTSGGVAYSIPDGIVDGFTKCVKIKSTTGTPAGTLTPAHMADGSAHTVSWNAAGGSFCLSWDATGGTYRVAGVPTGVVVN